jgi:hypothetical protein
MHRGESPPARRAEPAAPARAVNDQDREAAALHLQRACGDGRLTLEEFTDRVGTVWAADSSAELERATAGIAPAPAGRPAPSSRTIVNIIGDHSEVGRWRVPRRLRVVSLLGDCTLDLRGALINEDAMADGLVEITQVPLLGDVTVIVPDGVEVELGGLILLGDRRVELAPGAPSHGSPCVKLRVFSLLGDVTVRSAPPSAVVRR